jgi:hypothetical protein
VFGKTALGQLEAEQLVGREEVLIAVHEALDGLLAGRSRFVVVEGAPGMGKTAVLESVRGTLQDDQTLKLASARGAPQEAHRPFYIGVQLLGQLLHQEKEGGKQVLESLDEESLGYLSELLPQLNVEAGPTTDTPSRRRRECLFNAVAELLRSLSEQHPLVLLLDDLQEADEASLHLIRVLLEGGETPLFACATAPETPSLGDSAARSRLELFYERCSEWIQRVQLRPLEGEDVGEHLRGLFPGLSMPQGFEGEIASITQGNPLFLGEIVRKLVGDGRITFTSGGWAIAPLEEGYLPRSLEEVVRHKVAYLDDEGQHILAQASTLGENLSLSHLAGSSQLDELQILEFMDRAETLGLVRLDFQLNDETLRFLGKRILEITYGDIDPEQREFLHEKAGNYHERLFDQRLLPSASLLAYHFKRSANREKATRYERLQQKYDSRVFDPAEAAEYTGEPHEEPGEEEKLLSPESLSKLPNVLRTLLSGVRSLQLYPPDSQPVLRTRQQIANNLGQILEVDERLSLSQSQNALFASGQRLAAAAEYKTLVPAILELMSRAELKELTFLRGVTETELGRLVETLGRLRPHEVGRGFWREVAAAQAFEHVEVVQLAYKEVWGEASVRSGPEPPGPGREQPLGRDELAQLPNLLRLLTSAATNVRLYPLGSERTGRFITQLHDKLQEMLSRRGWLTIAGARGALLVNGPAVSTKEFEPVAASFLAFLDSVELASVSFGSSITTKELEVFLGALRDPGPGKLTREYWKELARREGLAGLAFNRLEYRAAASAGDRVVGPQVEEQQETGGHIPEPTAEPPAPPMIEETREERLTSLSQRGREMLARGELSQLWQLLRDLFEGFETLDPGERKRTAQATRALVKALETRQRHQLAELASEHVLGGLAAEEEQSVLEDLATVLYQLASAAVQFSDHQLAARILATLRTRQKTLQEADGARPDQLALVFDRRLDAAAETLLEADLQSGDAERQQRAAGVFEALGPTSGGPLVEVIKQEPDLRIRKLAAGLLSRMGPEAGEQIKRELILEVAAEQRFRMLEVCDVATTDLTREVALCLGDLDPRVRRAAFQLADRLCDEGLLDTLEGFAGSGDLNAAKGAISCIANLRSEPAVSALASILGKSRQPEVAVACCQGLGQIGTGTAVETLAHVLFDRKLRVLKHRWDGQVRATAALALLHIRDPAATAVLKRLDDDDDPRIRSLALSAPSTGPATPPRRESPPPEDD